MVRTAALRRTTRTPRTQSSPADQVPPAPVLFRFPNLAGHDAGGSDPATEAGMAPTDFAPTAAESITAAPQTSGPGLNQRATSNVSREAVAELTPESGSESKTSPATNQPAATPQTLGNAQARSWWEHWSSGLVLLLLVMALITASVVAFSDSSSTDPSLHADAEQETFDIPSLADVPIADSILAGAPNPSQAASPAVAPAVANDIANDIAIDLPAPAPEATAEADIATSDSLIPDALELSDPALLSLDNQPTPPLSISVSRETTNPAVATLGQPRIEATAHNPPLNPTTQAVGYSLPAFPVATQTESAQTESSAAGASPGLYDGAMVNTPPQSGQATTSPDFAPSMPNPADAMATQLTAGKPEVPAAPGNTTAASESMLASEMHKAAPAPALPTTPALPNFSTPQNQLTSGPNSLPVSNASHPQPASTVQQPSSPTAVASPPAILQTAAPEMNTEATIRAWQRYNAELKASQGPTANRYQQ